MTLRNWLLSSAVATVGFSTACSSESHSCYVTHTCPVAGTHAGGAAGASGETDDGEKAKGGRSDGGGSSGEAGRQDGSDADAGSGGEDGTSDGIPVLFGTCERKGAFACVEHASAQRLACDGTRWQAGTTCAAGQLCDSSNGKCASIVTECASAKPAAVVCRGDALLTCGEDLVTATEGQKCAGLCKLGVCQPPSCGDDKIETGEDCEVNAATVPGACVKCKAATCGDGVVYEGHEQCDDGNLVSGDGCSATCRAEPVDLALGDGFTCARSSMGMVKCWGDNYSGQLGLDDQDDRGGDPATVPSKLSAVNLGLGRTATAISARASTVCALLDNGDVKCWGNNDAGQLGTGDVAHRGDQKGEMAALNPISLGAGLKARAVDCAEAHTCVVLTDGRLKCWGSNEDGELGQGNTGSTVLSPANAPPSSLGRLVIAVTGFDYFTLAGNYGATCALLDDSSVRCWGSTNYVPKTTSSDVDNSGGIGDYAGEMDALPSLKFGIGVSSIALPRFAAVLNDGSLRQWNGEQPNVLTGLPAVQLAGAKIKSFAQSVNHSCAVLDDGVLNCWGNGYWGQLGIGSTDSTSGAPKDVPRVKLGGKALKVAVGSTHTCAILDDGTVKCWGNNSDGQLGLGDHNQRLSPDKAVELTF